MPQKAPTIPCRHCAGTGSRPLPAHLVATYHAVAALRVAQLHHICERIRARSRVDVQNNLLALISLGVVERTQVVEQRGARWVYSLSRERRRRSQQKKGRKS